MAPTPHKRGTETILLVDDERVLRRLMARVLKVEGYEVVEAGSGAEARAVWADRADSIDLLLTDMVLPGDQTGRQLAEALAQARPSLKIIFTSGYSPDFTAAGFTLEEGVNFLRKPHTLAQLVRIVRNCLDGP